MGTIPNQLMRKEFYVLLIASKILSLFLLNSTYLQSDAKRSVKIVTYS